MGQDEFGHGSTVKMETLCGRFCADISITAHHIGIPLHSEAK